MLSWASAYAAEHSICHVVCSKSAWICLVALWKGLLTFGGCCTTERSMASVQDAFCPSTLLTSSIAAACRCQLLARCTCGSSSLPSWQQAGGTQRAGFDAQHAHQVVLLLQQYNASGCVIHSQQALRLQHCAGATQTGHDDELGPNGCRCHCTRWEKRSGSDMTHDLSLSHHGSQTPSLQQGCDHWPHPLTCVCFPLTYWLQ